MKAESFDFSKTKNLLEDLRIELKNKVDSLVSKTEEFLTVFREHKKKAKTANVLSGKQFAIESSDIQKEETSWVEALQIMSTLFTQSIAISKIGDDATIISRNFSESFPDFNNWIVGTVQRESAGEAMARCKKFGNSKDWTVKTMNQIWFEDRYGFWSTYFKKMLDDTREELECTITNGTILPKTMPPDFLGLLEKFESLIVTGGESGQPIIKKIVDKCKDLDWLFCQNIEKLEKYELELRNS